MKKLITIAAALLAACGQLKAQTDTLQFSNEYLDTVNVKRAVSINDYAMLGVNYGVIKKSGSFYSYDGKKLAQGRDAVKNVLRENPDLAEEIEAKLMEALKK